MANPSTAEIRAAMTVGSLGAIITPAQGNRIPDGSTWCADNGCFGTGYPGDQAWIQWLASKVDHANSCLFATAPDVVGDAEATLERSLPWLKPIRDLGFPAALVAQDGLENLEIPWERFDVLFIGGSTEWKLGRSARHLIAEAKRRGKWVHMGRVNSRRRYDYARHIGCDSADGTKLAFGPDVNLPQVLRWSNPDLFIGGAA